MVTLDNLFTNAWVEMSPTYELAAGTGVTFTTNAGVITVASTATGGGTNFAGIIVTNTYERTAVHIGSITNPVISWHQTNVVEWSPASNAGFTLSGTPGQGTNKQVITLTLVLTNTAITSVVFPVGHRDGSAPFLMSVPSTNTFSIVYDGRRTYIESGQEASGLPALLPQPNNGAVLASDGTATPAWSFGTPNGRWAIDEEFWSFIPSVDGQVGTEYWDQAITGTVIATNSGALGFGVLSLNARTIASRWSATLGVLSVPTTRFTNAQAMFLTRIMRSALDNTTDGTNTLRIGFADRHTDEPNNGIYWRSTNNLWQLITARSSSRTITDCSNMVANAWIDFAWVLDSTGTNVFGYMGTSATNMACVATNSTNIPHDTFSQPLIHAQAIVTNAGVAAGITNLVDYFKLWVKHN